MAAIVAVFGAGPDPSLSDTLKKMAGAEPARGRPSFVQGDFFALASQAARGEASLVRESPAPLALDSWLGGLESQFNWLGPSPSADDASAATSRLPGAFAFVLVNPADRRVYASCDVAGCRPLFFTIADGRLTLATTARQVLAGSSIPKRMNRDVVAQYLANRPANAGESIFHGVSRVHPGTVVEFEFDMVWKVAHVRRWWDPRALSPWRGRQGEEAEALCGVLLGVIDRALSGGGSAISLSGGKDSGSIWSLAGSLPAGESAMPISLVFDGLECDESRFLEGYGATDREPQVHVEAGTTVPSEFLPFFVRSLGTIPYTTTHFFALLAEAAAREARTVFLAGIGGDEWFTSSWASAIRSTLSGSARVAWTIKLLRVLAGADGWWGRHQLRRGLANRMDVSGRRRWPRPEGVRYTASREPGDGPDSSGNGLSAHAAGRLSTLRRHQGGWVLDSVEQVVAAHGVELRLPFMDREVIEFAIRVPPERLAVEGGDKGLLVAAAARRTPLPPAVSRRRKRTHFSCIVDRDEALFDLPVASSWFLVREGVLDEEWLDANTRPGYRHDQVVSQKLAWFRLADKFLGRMFHDKDLESSERL